MLRLCAARADARPRLRSRAVLRRSAMGDAAALVNQFLSMSDEQVAKLTPEQQASVKLLRQQALGAAAK